MSNSLEPSTEQQWLDAVVADLAARQDEPLAEPRSPEDLDELAEERDRVAETRDVLAERRADGLDAELDRGRAREDRSRSAADRDRAAVARERAAVDLQELREALVSRAEIGQAQGILMHRLGIDAQEAFSLLVQASQNHDQKLRVIAARVLREGWPLAPAGGRKRG